MFFRPKIVNCQQSIERIKKLARISEEGFTSDKDLAELRSLLKQINSHVIYNINRNSHISDFESRKLKDFLDLSRKCIVYSGDSKKDLDSRISSALQYFNKIYDNSACYLVRHPDPDPAAYSDEAYRNLSSIGVKQAKEFADRLADEIMMCPKNVILHIFFSSKRRTQLFADFVARKAYSLRDNYKKNVIMSDFKEIPELYPPITKETRNNYPGFVPIYNEIRAGRSTSGLRKKAADYFKMALKELSITREVAQSIHLLMDRYSILDSSKDWHISLFFTHDVTISTFLYHKLRFSADDSFVGTAEFVKKINGGYSYRKRWYTQ